MCRRNGKNNNNNNNEMYIIFHKVMRLSCAMYSISIAQSIPKKKQKTNQNTHIETTAESDNCNIQAFLLHYEYFEKKKGKRNSNNNNNINGTTEKKISVVSLKSRRHHFVLCLSEEYIFLRLLCEMSIFIDRVAAFIEKQL